MLTRPLLGRLKESAVEMMDNMAWMRGGMAIVWLLLVILLVLGIAALLKYLLGVKQREPAHPLYGVTDPQSAACILAATSAHRSAAQQGRHGPLPLTLSLTRCRSGEFASSGNNSGRRIR